MRCFMWTEKTNPSSAGRAVLSAPLGVSNQTCNCGEDAPPRLLSRRQMLHRMCAGFGMVGLSGLLDPKFLLASGDARLPHFAPRARRVIFLFLNGGPSHVDTFDPKPALKKCEGQQPSGELYKKNKGSGFMPSPFEF